MADTVRKISILGDSISTFAGASPSGGEYYGPGFASVTGVSSVQDTWWMQVIHALGGELLANDSWSGSTVAASGLMPACSLSRLRKLAPDGVTPDQILVFTGLNDAYCYIGPEEFGQDYERMLQQLRTLYPQAEIFCGTLLKGYLGDPAVPHLAAFGQRLQAYNQKIRAAVRCTSGCHTADLAVLKEEYASLDGLHPNGQGMKQLAALWLRCLPPRP